jgi:hypothetical protein
MTLLAFIHGLTTDWRARAACRGLDDEMFPDSNAADIAHAQQICAPCPVREQCLADAMATEGAASARNRYGIRAGLTGSQRRARYEALRKQQTGQQKKTEPKPQPKKREPAKCGTRGGYQKHLREKTEICGPCRQANTDADNRLRRTGTSKAAA